MITRRAAFLGGLLATVSFVVMPARAFGQATPQPVGQSGPIVLMPISTSIVFSPDVKVTTVNRMTAVLAGGYVGKLIEGTVLVGGGAYWLADPRDDARLFYGGLILGARVLGTDRLNLTTRGLVGFGQGTVVEAREVGAGRHGFGHEDRWRPDGRFVRDERDSTTMRFRFSDAFLVAEPEARVSFQVTSALSLTVGGGYRLTSARGGLNGRFRGATGSVGILFEVGK